MNIFKKLFRKRKIRKEAEQKRNECWHSGGNSDERQAMGLDGAYLSPNFYDAAYTNQIAKK